MLSDDIFVPFDPDADDGFAGLEATAPTHLRVVPPPAPKTQPAARNGHATGGWDERAADRLIIEDTAEAERLLKSHAMLIGQNGTQPREDMRFGSVSQERPNDERRYVLGLAGITVHMGEIQPGELTLVGAREGMGKTAWAEMMAVTNSREHKVLYATLEMTREEIHDRILARKMGLPLSSYRNELRDNTQRYRDTRMLVASQQLYLWQPPPPERGVASITKRAENGSFDLLIIDYQRRIGGWQPGKEASDIMDYLTDWVKATGIATVLCAQLNRDAAGHRPTNKFFQDTGKMEQVADRCILLHRPFLGKPAYDNIVEVIVSKNRQGACFRNHAHWHGATMSFASMDEYEEQRAPCCQKRQKGGDD